MLPLRMMRFVQGFGYRPVDDLSAVLMAGVRKPSGKEPAGGGVGGVLSMGICRGSVLGRGCTGRRNGRRTDDRGRDFPPHYSYAGSAAVPLEEHGCASLWI